MKLFRVLVVALLLTLPAAVVSAARIEISSPGEQTIPLALTRLLPLAAPQAGIAEEFQQVLQNDLELSGLFALVDPAAFLGDARRLGLRRSDIDFQQWRILGSEALIKGGYRVADGKLTVELRLYDVITQRLLSGRRYVGKLTDVRMMAHKFADQVLLSLTEEAGPFATKIAYISNRTGHKELYLMDVDGHRPIRLKIGRAHV